MELYLVVREVMAQSLSNTKEARIPHHLCCGDTELLESKSSQTEKLLNYGMGWKAIKMTSEKIIDSTLLEDDRVMGNGETES